MIYVRGNRHDYDRWAQMGLSGWSYDEVLPAFRRSEEHVERDGAFHGTGGELTVCRARGANPLFDVFVEAGRQAGHPVNDDFNGAEQQGIGRYDFTIRRGKRCSVSTAFLRPIRHRRNLAIVTDSLVRRVVVEGDHATGVEVAHGNRALTIRAEREVILCAGTVNSPQLLMLSGIGPGDELRQHGIQVIHELPRRRTQPPGSCRLRPRLRVHQAHHPLPGLARRQAHPLGGRGDAVRPRGRHDLPLRSGRLPEEPGGAGGAGHPGALHAGAGEDVAKLHFPKPFRKPPLGGDPRLSACAWARSIPRAGGGSGCAPPIPPMPPLIQPNYLEERGRLPHDDRGHSHGPRCHRAAGLRRLSRAARLRRARRCRATPSSPHGSAPTR